MTEEMEHTAWSIPGLERPGDLRGIEALQALLAADDSALVNSLASWSLELRLQVASVEPALESFVGVPAGEMLASPFAFRASMMGMSNGVAAVHEECRTQGHWPAHLMSEDPSIVSPAEVWDDGKLTVAKYTSFCQDQPFVSFHPAHSSKWTPHEMVHRVLGFFYRENMTPFECYLGARLNEAIPVALWYGLDRVARLDEDPEAPPVESEQHEASREHCLWVSESEEDLRERLTSSVEHFRSGLTWILSEWEAVRQELRTGQVVSRPGGYLDGSGDAMAYVVAHLKRLRDKEVASVIQTLPREGEQRFDSIPRYLKHWEDVLDGLLFGPVNGNLAEAEKARAHRQQWDTALFALLNGDENVAGDDDVHLAPGYGWQLTLESNTDWGQVVEGLESVFPATLHALGEGDPEALILTHFVEERGISVRGSLGLRFLEVLEEFEAPFVHELARFEWLIQHGLKRSDQHERLAMESRSSADFESGVLMGHPHFDLLTLSPDMLQYYNGVMGQEDSGFAGASVFIVGKYGDEVVMLPAPPAIAGIWLHIKHQLRPVKGVLETLEGLLQGQGFPEGWPQVARDWIDAMVALGAVAWTLPWEGIEVDAGAEGE